MKNIFLPCLGERYSVCIFLNIIALERERTCPISFRVSLRYCSTACLHVQRAAGCFPGSSPLPVSLTVCTTVDASCERAAGAGGGAAAADASVCGADVNISKRFFQFHKSLSQTNQKSLSTLLNVFHRHSYKRRICADTVFICRLFNLTLPSLIPSPLSSSSLNCGRLKPWHTTSVMISFGVRSLSLGGTCCYWGKSLHSCCRRSGGQAPARPLVSLRG